MKRYRSGTGRYRNCSAELQSSIPQNYVVSEFAWLLPFCEVTVFCCSAAIVRSKAAAQKWKAKAQANRLEVTVAPVSGDATILYMNKHTSTVHDTKVWMEKNAGTKRGCQVLVDVAGNELHDDTLLRAVAGCGDRSLALYQLLKEEEGHGNIDRFRTLEGI